MTDGYLDVDTVREGAIILIPVKVDGGGIYAGDAHAMQGDGEVAGHTTDVTAESVVEVSVVKNINLDGPILLPPEKDLSSLARPWRKDEWDNIQKLAKGLALKLNQSLQYR